MVNLVQTLAAHQALAIIRAESESAAIRTARELIDAGITLLEVSLTTPRAFDAIAAITHFAPDVGAGTVLTAEDAARAGQAGARFLVTPTVPSAEILAHGLPVLAGAFTPTEILRAYQAGAAAVKVFPAGVLGPQYVAAVRAPLPEIPLVAVGSIALEEVGAYLQAGAVAVGLGNPLVGDLDAIPERAARLREVLA